MLLRPKPKCRRCGAVHVTAAAALCENCAGDASVNDNSQPAPASISFTDLALAMQLDEDTLLQRFAALLHKRGATTGGAVIFDAEPE